MPRRKEIGPSEKITQLFDRDWKNGKSTIRTRTQDKQSYDVSYSWNGRSDNPMEFSRLQATEMPVQPSKPITMSFAAVVELEKGETFDALNQYNLPMPKTKVGIPLTSEQRDIGMLPDLSATIPLRIDSMISGGEKLVVFDERPSFKNNMVRPPKINSIDVPEVYKEAGPQWDQKLLNPAQRREIFEFEKKRLEAKAFIHDAVGAREKTRKQLEGMNFKRGVLMVDSNLNEDSEIFGQRAREEREEREFRAHLNLERRSAISKNRGFMDTTGNIILPQTIHPRVKIEKDYQSKKIDA